jgi:hypothetical protein
LPAWEEGDQREETTTELKLELPPATENAGWANFDLFNKDIKDPLVITETATPESTAITDSSILQSAEGSESGDTAK